jgi:hypothetical protein
MKRLGLGIIVAIGLTLPAQADDKLKGTYASVSKVSCLQSSGGFDSKFDALGPVISISEFMLEGLRTYNGDGTGAITQQKNTGYSYPINGPFFFPSASSGEITAPTPFTYTVTGDQITITLGTTQGVVLTGSRAGQTSVTVGTPPQVGFIAKDDKVILSAPLSPVVQKITFSDGTVIPRICHNAAVETKLDDE